MEVDNLTTGDQDPQVNSEIQDDANSSEVMVDETKDNSTSVDGSISNEQAQEEAYADAWDNVDVNDDAIFERTFNATNDEPESVDTPVGDPLSTTQNTNNNIGAFMVDKPVLKFKGKEIPIDSSEELINLAQKGMQMETAAAEMKPKKKVLSIVDGIPLEVLQAVADIHGGNTNAIGYIKKQYGIEDTRSTESEDSFWGNENSNKEETPPKETYTPAVAVENPMEDFWENYSAGNQQMAGKVSDTYGSLDEGFKSEIYQPNVFPAFVQSVESGEFDSAYPIAIKEKSLNPAMTWLQAYGAAVGKLGQVPAKQTEPPASATPPSNGGGTDRNMSDTNKADRVWNDDAYFNDLESKLFG